MFSTLLHQKFQDQFVTKIDNHWDTRIRWKYFKICKFS